MRLIRGWESRYSPNEIGSTRLSTACLFRKIGEEDGLGDTREGEIRVAMPGRIESQGSQSLPSVDFTIVLEDQPAVHVENLQPGETRGFQSDIRAEDSALASPFLFCLSREPKTKQDWEKLRAALPERYDTWTITDNANALRFEIECGLKRWIALEGLTEHTIWWRQDWVNYSYDEFPPSVAPGDLAEAMQLQRWFRKRRKYREQREYRLAWVIRSPQAETLPDKIDIELTRTGLSLFRPWYPPTT